MQASGISGPASALYPPVPAGTATAPPSAFSSGYDQVTSSTASPANAYAQAAAQSAAVPGQVPQKQPTPWLLIAAVSTASLGALAGLIALVMHNRPKGQTPESADGDEPKNAVTPPVAPGETPPKQRSPAAEPAAEKPKPATPHPATPVKPAAGRSVVAPILKYSGLAMGAVIVGTAAASRYYVGDSTAYFQKVWVAWPYARNVTINFAKVPTVK